VNKKMVLTSNESGNLGFAIHAEACADIAKQRWSNQAADSLDIIANEIAKCYGGFSDNGDAPANAKEALSWAAVKACTRKAVR